MQNGVNFHVRNNASGQTQIVHHDRLTPWKKHVDPQINIYKGQEMYGSSDSDSNDTNTGDSSSSDDDHKINIESSGKPLSNS